ncbi:MAG TPA: condensation domain-containing protein, partial [Thermoanaerobaculia bacterium]
MREAFAGAEIAVLYGPTEGTILASWEGSQVRSGSWIGRPLPGVALEVRDHAGMAVPPGTPGELWLGGPGVARGYLGRPELTAERFVPDAAGRGARFYRTGDRVRFAAAGRLEFLGRVDDQVKVRGFRIEPGEVEAVLLAYPGVRGAAVLAQRQEGGDERLVAYVAREESLESAELRRFVEARLPSHMVPSRFFQVDTLPLTRHGKVDRRALPGLALETEAPEWVPPRTAAEELVAGLFGEVLSLERVGADGHFFELGGHSLLATQLASRLREVLGVELPLRTLFEQPTVAGIARAAQEMRERLEASRQDPAWAAPPLSRVARTGDLLLSFAQQRLWFLHQLDPQSPAYNVLLSLLLEGPLDVEALALSLSAVVRRHEALRTRFPLVDGRPVQAIDPAVPQELPVVDLRGLAAAARRPEVQRLGLEDALRPFDLSRGPLLRASLLRLEDQSWVTLFALHHIVGDGWSTGVLAREISAVYRELLTGDDPGLPDLAIQYADFASWQREWLAGPVLAAEIDHWRGHLHGIPPVLELPLDRPRPPLQSFRGTARHFHLPGSLAEGLRVFCRGGGVTLFMALLSSFQALLSRLAGQELFAVGTPIAGRNRLETEGLIGFFVNTLVLRADVAGNPACDELLRRVRRDTLEAYAHQDLPFEKLVEELAPERNLAHAPVCQAMLVLQNTPSQELSIPGVSSTSILFGTSTAQLDLTWTLTETDSGLAGLVVYSTDLFDGTTVERWIGQFAAVLAAVVADGEIAVADLPLLGSAERHQIVCEWSGSGRGEVGTISALFAEQVD